MNILIKNPNTIPNDESEWIRQGIKFQNEGDHRAAMACFDIALDLNPDNVEVWWKKAIALRQCGPQRFGMKVEEFRRWEVQCYEEILRLKPNDLFARSNLAGIYSDLNEFHKAVNLLLQILKHGGANALGPNVSPAMLFIRLANTYWNAGEYNQVINVMKLAEESGIAEDELKKIKARIDEITVKDEKGAVQKPVYIDVTGGPLSHLFQEVSELRYLKLNDEMVSLVEDIRLKHGSTAEYESFRVLENLLNSINKNSSELHNELPSEFTDTAHDVLYVWGCEAIENNDFTQARFIISKLQEVSKEKARLEILQGYYYSAQHKFKEALHFFVEAVNEDPYEPDTWSFYTDCLMKMEKWDEARELCLAGVYILPKEDRRLMLMHAQLVGMDDPIRALGILHRMKKLFKDEHIGLLEALYLTQLGNASDAQKILKTLDPEFFQGEFAEKCHWLKSLHRLDS